ncbi:hypothetical protein D3C78_1895030 [compost metagenome]
MGFSIQGQGDARAVLAQLADDLTRAGWRSGANDTPTERTWSFNDTKGRAWKGLTTASEAGGSVRLNLRVEADH